MPTDTERIDWLEKQNGNGRSVWEPRTRRLQAALFIAETSVGRDNYATVREAIDAAMREEEK